jgi:8-oxo-dGTP diphosphatase
MNDAPARIDFDSLKTERLALRPYAQEDAAELHRLLNDFEVCRMLAAVPFPYDRTHAQKWITSARSELTRGRAYHLVIAGTEGEREMIVGGVGLRLNHAGRPGDLGYWVARRYWGHGVATEAVGRLVRWAFANLEIDRIEADVATDNGASIAVLRRIGFRQVATGTRKFLARGAEHKVLRFEATRDDLPASGAAADVPAPEDGAEKPLVLVAACALIDADGRVLLARRPEGKKMAGLWEFPGGKLNPGETPEAALIRELQEELGIDVARNCLAAFTFASHAYPKFHLLMPLFLCRRWQGTVTAREGQTLAWVSPDKLSEYKMPEADRPLVPLLRDFL